MTEILDAMSRPDVNGTPSLPKRSAPKGLLPSTWLERTLKLEYVDSSGVGQATSGTLLDLYPAGPILSVAERRRRQDDDFVGPARALRAGRRLRGEG
jgi:hypothetical protein